MTVRLNHGDSALWRAGLTAALSALLITSTMAPTYAADTPDPSRISVNEATRSVGGKPSAPRGVIAGILSDTSVRVDFLDAETPVSSPVTSYTVTLTPTGSSKKMEKTLSTPNELRKKSVVFDGLTTNETYKIEVVAANKAGVGPAASPAYTSVKLSRGPKPSLAVSTSAGLNIDKLDPSQPVTFIVAGTGYTGEAAEKYGIDVVVSDDSLWSPGYFPIELPKKIHISPDKISRGRFSAEITVDVKKDKIDFGRHYVVGTLAAGDAQIYERRLDQAQKFDYAPAAPRNAKLTKVGEGKDVRVTWDRPTEDPRVSAYTVKLHKVENGQETYVNQREVGKALNAVEFSGLKDGVYIASVVSEIARNSDRSVTPLRSAPAKTEQLTISAKESNKPKTVPEAPTKLTLRLALKDAKALEAFWNEPSTSSGKITNYDIELSGSDKSVKKLKANMKDALPEFLKISSLTPGVTYTFKVRAENAQGWSPWSEESNKVTIPANQDEFAMTPPDEVFARVDKETNKVSVGWINSGYEPKNGQWHVRVECVSSCPAAFSPFSEKRPTSVDGIVLDKLQPGVYRAVLTLVNGKRTSGPVASNNFVVGAPAVVPQPQITVTPTSDIDPSVKNIFTVNGAGYIGTSASKGIYVVVADPAVWTPGKTPTPSATARFAGQVWVKPEQIVNGVFTAKIEVPAGKFDPKKSYVVGTMAAHQLSIADRSMDAGKAISFASSGQPEATPKPSDKPKPEATPKPEAKQPEAKPKPEFTQPEATPKPEAKQPETKQPEATQPEAKQLQTKPQPEVMSAKVDSSKAVTPAKKLAFTGAQAMTWFVASLVLVILGAAVVVIRRLRR
ncbi:fibronectin type III domain-containing protein [Trueperella pyogenes]|nr:fibronectin type III domain-containing protein [Trueperella pyogenes]